MTDKVLQGMEVMAVFGGSVLGATRTHNNQ